MRANFLPSQSSRHLHTPLLWRSAGLPSTSRLALVAPDAFRLKTMDPACFENDDQPKRVTRFAENHTFARQHQSGAIKTDLSWSR